MRPRCKNRDASWYTELPNAVKIEIIFVCVLVWGAVYCVDASEEIVVEFGDSLASAVLMSDVLLSEAAVPTPACLSLRLITSLIVNITIAVSSSLPNLASSSHVVTKQSCLPNELCHWQRSVLVNSGDRLFIAARKFRVTDGRVTFVSVVDASITPHNCSSDAASSN